MPGDSSKDLEGTASTPLAKVLLARHIQCDRGNHVEETIYARVSAGYIPDYKRCIYCGRKRDLNPVAEDLFYDIPDHVLYDEELLDNAST